MSYYINIDISEVKSEINKIYRIMTFENTLFNNKDLEFQSKDMKYIDSLDGFQFEDYLADMFKNMNFQVEQTKYSGDNGIDLIISDDNISIGIQAKNYTSSKVGNDAVQKTYAGMVYYKCDKCVIITNSSFTKQAVELAENLNVILIDRVKFQYILDNGKSEWELILNN